MADRQPVSDSAMRYMEAARVPTRLAPQAFGLWNIKRVDVADFPPKLRDQLGIGWTSYTLLHRYTLATMMHGRGEVVMEDSIRELRKHLPIWMNARGRVLVTGLGLGCVVRGLLANPDVDHIDVVEIDRHIIRVVGHEFVNNRRVAIRHGDALKAKWPPGTTWDAAWHDLWTEDGNRELHLMHAELLGRYARRCPSQGAWAFPRVIGRIWPKQLLGMKRRAA